jgi:HAD superfamily hydrolase (TIGR01509 family)
VQAVLWDFDGTLVDTEPYWIDAEFELVARHGGTWTHEHALNLVGNDLLVSGRYIREHAGIELEPAEIVEQLLDAVIARVQRRVPWRPGAVELLASLRRAGLPCVLVTMSYRRFVDPVLASLPAGMFTALVTGDAVARGKPHPEPYLKAAAELDLPPSSCLAVEDSETGARSAEAAGCHVLVVPNHVVVEPGTNRIFRDTLVGLDAATLLQIVAGSRPEPAQRAMTPRPRDE